MRDINGKTKLLGVIGNPIEHTLSPVIHNTLCDILGINAVYVPIHVEDDISSAVKGLYASNVKGLNITVPFKQQVMEQLVAVDPLAERIGAVNTLVPAEGGYKGYNTDMPGLRRALESKEVGLAGKKAIVIGAGGASRAVCIMLADAGVDKIYLLNRSIDKAERIAREISQVTALGLSDYKSIPQDASYIMFQCTSVGLKSGDGLLIEDDDFYRLADYGYDLIYNPAVTPFIRKMNELGIACDNGLSMLLYQGLIAFEYWFDIKIDQEVSGKVYDALRASLYGASDHKEENISENAFLVEQKKVEQKKVEQKKAEQKKGQSEAAHNIILVGYMGSGKTTVGRAMAERYNMKLIDTDEYIVESEKKSINDIFAQIGEAGFRRLETEKLRSMLGIRDSIVSTGGGIVISEENRKILKKLGRVVYLKTSPDTIFERVKNDDQRPLLKSGSEAELKKKINDILSKRLELYADAADIIVETDNKSIEDILQEIIEECNKLW